ncbi:UNVERIFIED_CONTAM: hypothetical protein Sindi_1272000 [Sesamum indicum]
MANALPSSGCHLLDQDKGKASSVEDLRRGALSPGDKQLLSPLKRRIGRNGGSLYLQGTPPILPNDAQKQNLKDRIERLRNENTKLRKTKKEVTSYCQQLEREVKKLQKEAAKHE